MLYLKIMVKFFFDGRQVEDITIDVFHRDDEGAHIETNSLTESAPKEVEEIKVSVDGQFLHSEMYIGGKLLKVHLTPFFRISSIDIEYQKVTEKEITI